MKVFPPATATIHEQPTATTARPGSTERRDSSSDVPGCSSGGFGPRTGWRPPCATWPERAWSSAAVSGQCGKNKIKEEPLYSR